MGKLDIKKLKEDLADLRIKVAELKISKQQESSRIEYEIAELKRNIVDNHQLLQYDLNIKSEIHKTQIFISDIERLIISNS